jgi:hypothetical protein
LLLFAALLFAFPAVLFGHAYFGTLSGVVSDPTRAVIPKAKVTLTDQEKGYKFSATSDNAGRYLFSAVPPGVYSVAAEVSGFERLSREGIHIDINQNAKANLDLKMAGSVQTVQVGAQTLHTEDATTGLVINRKFINDSSIDDPNFGTIT